MSLPADILARKETHFVLWRPAAIATPPQLLIGQYRPGNPSTLADPQRFAMTPAGGVTGLWEIAAADCGLRSGEIYFYWFVVVDTDITGHAGQPIACTDPLALTVDWRLYPPNTDDQTQPGSVIKFDDGRLVPCDPGGELGVFDREPGLNTLPANNRLVIYEMPTAWTRIEDQNSIEKDVGSFRDVMAMSDKRAPAGNFADLAILQPGESYLVDLGINAIELLPPADSFFKREWGYDTAHFLAADWELGFPLGNTSPTANADLTALVQTCHLHGIRFFVDVVMAFGRREPYEHIDHGNFYIDDPACHPDDPDAETSTRGFGRKEIRNGFGSLLFRYTKPVHGVYDPISGHDGDIVPARQLMFTYLTRWMRDFHIDGIRMDSVENVANWDFVGGFKNLARQLWQDRWDSQGLGAGAGARFLVVGEELSLPLDLLVQGRLDGLWNDAFRGYVRAAILGENGGESSFEWTVRKLVDCRNLGFQDGAQAINYITSHDVEGFRHERLFTMLRGFPDRDRRIKLAFACLLTAVGVPMILAGEEFADQHDFFDENGNVSQKGGKQVDPVNYSRAEEPARKEILSYVSRLVKFRTTHPALGVNDTEFIHVDLNDGKRVLVWRRGGPGDDPVVVLANFSDFVTADAGSPTAEYHVPNWPATPPGRRWREVSQGRDVPQEWAGREPIYPWEAKIYTLA